MGFFNKTTPVSMGFFNFGVSNKSLSLEGNFELKNNEDSKSLERQCIDLYIS